MQPEQTPILVQKLQMGILVSTKKTLPTSKYTKMLLQPGLGPERH